MTTQNTQPTLAELITSKRGDRTYAKLSRDCGGSPTDSRLQALASDRMKSFPDVDTIQRLAIGLRVNVSDVLHAAARTLGLTIASADPGALILPGAGHLPESAKQTLAEVASELLRMQQSIGATKDFTEYQAQLRQDFAAGARLRRVPAGEIEGALQGPGWSMVGPDDDALTVTDAVLGWVDTANARQLKAALRDVLAQGAGVAQSDVDLAADKGQPGLDPETDVAPA